MNEHVLPDGERILQCKQRIIAALNEAHVPLAVSALILENVQMQVQLEMQKGAEQCQKSTTTAN